MAKEVGVSEEFSCRWWNVALVYDGTDSPRGADYLLAVLFGTVSGGRFDNCFFLLIPLS